MNCAAKLERVADVAVLYVDPRGPYPELVEHWYDEARDARSYTGPWPVVAHPPCGPWGRLRHLSRHDSPEHGPHAVELVRRLGGVLEHPQHSLLFRHCGMPHPGELPDAWGGVTFEVAQCDWGHPARKRTWIYVVGARKLPPAPPSREPTHWISGGRGRVGKKAKTTPVPPGIKVCSAQQRRRTPIAFAQWLIEVARAAQSTGAKTSPHAEDRSVTAGPRARCNPTPARAGDEAGPFGDEPSTSEGTEKKR